MRVRITKLAKNPMQSALGKNNLWILTSCEDSKIRFVNKLTGWTACDDTESQLNIKFQNKEDAISYAQSKDFEYIIDEANKSTVKIKSYANNFTKPVL